MVRFLDFVLFHQNVRQVFGHVGFACLFRPVEIDQAIVFLNVGQKLIVGLLALAPGPSLDECRHRVASLVHQFQFPIAYILKRP
jgi:hypothetical protein